MISVPHEDIARGSVLDSKRPVNVPGAFFKLNTDGQEKHLT